MIIWNVQVSLLQKVIHPKIIFENLGQTRERCISFLTFMKCLINASKYKYEINAGDFS